MKKQLHIARNGQVIGQFDSDKISHFLETGRLLPTDHYFDEGTSTWLAVTEWKEPELKVRNPRPDSKSSSTVGSSRPRSSKSKKAGTSGLAGWVACIFVIGAAAGLWVWNQSLDEQIAHLKEDNTALKTTIFSVQKINDALNEVTPSGFVRGIIIYEPAPGQTAIVSGATVGLYPRQEVEKALTEVKSVDASAPFTIKIDKLKELLPSPLAVTLTDSNGRLNLAVPSPGDYVLVASATKGGSNEALHLIWLIGFEATDRPSSTILLDEKNAFSEKNVEMRILSVRNFTSAE